MSAQRRSVRLMQLVKTRKDPIFDSSLEKFKPLKTYDKLTKLHIEQDLVPKNESSASQQEANILECSDTNLPVIDYGLISSNSSFADDFCSNLIMSDTKHCGKAHKLSAQSSKALILTSKSQSIGENSSLLNDKNCFHSYSVLDTKNDSIGEQMLCRNNNNSYEDLTSSCCQKTDHAYDVNAHQFGNSENESDKISASDSFSSNFQSNSAMIGLSEGLLESKPCSYTPMFCNEKPAFVNGFKCSDVVSETQMPKKSFEIRVVKMKETSLEGKDGCKLDKKNDNAQFLKNCMMCEDEGSNQTPDLMLNCQNFLSQADKNNSKLEHSKKKMTDSKTLIADLLTPGLDESTKLCQRPLNDNCDIEASTYNSIAISLPKGKEVICENLSSKMDKSKEQGTINDCCMKAVGMDEELTLSDQHLMMSSEKEVGCLTNACNATSGRTLVDEGHSLDKSKSAIKLGNDDGPLKRVSVRASNSSRSFGSSPSKDSCKKKEDKGHLDTDADCSDKGDRNTERAGYEIPSKYSNRKSPNAYLLRERDQCMQFHHQSLATGDRGSSQIEKLYVKKGKVTSEKLRLCKIENDGLALRLAKPVGTQSSTTKTKIEKINGHSVSKLHAASCEDVADGDILSNLQDGSSIDVSIVASEIAAKEDSHGESTDEASSPEEYDNDIKNFSDKRSAKKMVLLDEVQALAAVEAVSTTDNSKSMPPNTPSRATEVLNLDYSSTSVSKKADTERLALKNSEIVKSFCLGKSIEKLPIVKKMQIIKDIDLRHQPSPVTTCSVISNLSDSIKLFPSVEKKRELWKDQISSSRGQVLHIGPPKMSTSIRKRGPSPHFTQQFGRKCQSSRYHNYPSVINDSFTIIPQKHPTPPCQQQISSSVHGVAYLNPVNSKSTEKVTPKKEHFDVNLKYMPPQKMANLPPISCFFAAVNSNVKLPDCEAQRLYECITPIAKNLINAWDLILQEDGDSHNAWADCTFDDVEVEDFAKSGNLDTLVSNTELQQLSSPAIVCNGQPPSDLSNSKKNTLSDDGLYEQLLLKDLESLSSNSHMLKNLLNCDMNELSYPEQPSIVAPSSATVPYSGAGPMLGCNNSEALITAYEQPTSHMCGGSLAPTVNDMDYSSATELSDNTVCVRKEENNAKFEMTMCSKNLNSKRIRKNDGNPAKEAIGDAHEFIPTYNYVNCTDLAKKTSFRGSQPTSLPYQTVQNSEKFSVQRICTGLKKPQHTMNLIDHDMLSSEFNCKLAPLDSSFPENETVDNQKNLWTNFNAKTKEFSVRALQGDIKPVNSNKCHEAALRIGGAKICAPKREEEKLRLMHATRQTGYSARETKRKSCNTASQGRSGATKVRCVDGFDVKALNRRDANVMRPWWEPDINDNYVLFTAKDACRVSEVQASCDFSDEILSFPMAAIRIATFQYDMRQRYDKRQKKCQTGTVIINPLQRRMSYELLMNQLKVTMHVGLMSMQSMACKGCLVEVEVTQPPVVLIEKLNSTEEPHLRDVTGGAIYATRFHQIHLLVPDSIKFGQTLSQVFPIFQALTVKMSKHVSGPQAAMTDTSCHCSSGSCRQKCLCFSNHSFCEKPCSCAKRGVCANPWNALRNRHINLHVAYSDYCLLHKISQFNNLPSLLCSKHYLACCQIHVALYEVIPGIVACPRKCGRLYRFSWCTSTLHEVSGVQALRHCVSCMCCVTSNHRTCNKCHKCYQANLINPDCPCTSTLLSRSIINKFSLNSLSRRCAKAGSMLPGVSGLPSSITRLPAAPIMRNSSVLQNNLAPCQASATLSNSAFGTLSNRVVTKMPQNYVGISNNALPTHLAQFMSRKTKINSKPPFPISNAKSALETSLTVMPRPGNNNDSLSTAGAVDLRVNSAAADEQSHSSVSILHKSQLRSSDSMPLPVPVSSSSSCLIRAHTKTCDGAVEGLRKKMKFTINRLPFQRSRTAVVEKTGQELSSAAKYSEAHGVINEISSISGEAKSAIIENSSLLNSSDLLHEAVTTCDTRKNSRKMEHDRYRTLTITSEKTSGQFSRHFNNQTCEKRPESAAQTIDLTGANDESFSWSLNDSSNLLDELLADGSVKQEADQEGSEHTSSASDQLSKGTSESGLLEEKLDRNNIGSVDRFLTELMEEVDKAASLSH